MIARRGLLIRFGALSGCRVGIRRFFRGIGGRGVSLLLGGLLRLAGVALALIALLLGLGPERRRTRKQEQCGEQSEIQHSPFILQGISSTRDGCASMPEELIQRATGRKADGIQLSAAGPPISDGRMMSKGKEEVNTEEGQLACPSGQVRVQSPRAEAEGTSTSSARPRRTGPNTKAGTSRSGRSERLVAF